MAIEHLAITEKEFQTIFFHIQKNLYYTRKYLGSSVEKMLIHTIEKKYNIELTKEFLINDFLNRGTSSDSYIFLTDYYDGIYNNTVKEFFTSLKNGTFNDYLKTHEGEIPKVEMSLIEEIEKIIDENLMTARFELYSINKRNYNDFISEFCSYVVNNETHSPVDPFFSENKELLLSFLNMTILTQLNKGFSESEKEIVAELFNDIPVKILSTYDEKKIMRGEFILSQITNAFSHKGEFYLNQKHGKMRIINSRKSSVPLENGDELPTEQIFFSIDLDLEFFNKAVERISALRNDGIISIMRDISNKIRNEKMEDISKTEGISLMLYLLLNFNKESMFDEYIGSQYSFIDASKFRVRYGKSSLDQTDYKNLQWIKNYLFKFANRKSEMSFDNEWKEIIESVSKNENSFKGDILVYDVGKQAYATDLCKHIPTPGLLWHLRNAIRHGNVEYSNGIFKFFDEDKKSGKYFNMEIAEDDLTKFLDSDIFQEVINMSPMENLSKRKDGTEFYYSETAVSKNSFSRYIEIMRYSFPEKSIENVLKYMYDNGMISRYLSDNPTQLEEFFHWSDGHGRGIVDYLSKFTGKDLSDGKYFDRDGKYELLREKARIRLEHELATQELGPYFESYFRTLKNLDKKSVFLKKDLTNYEIEEMYAMFLQNSAIYNNVTGSYEFDKMIVQTMLDNPEVELTELEKIFFVVYNSVDLQNKYGMNQKKKYSYKILNKTMSNHELVNIGRKKIIEISGERYKFINDFLRFALKLISMGVIAIPAFLGNIEFIRNNIDLIHGIYMFSTHEILNCYKLSSLNVKASKELLEMLNIENKSKKIF